MFLSRNKIWLFDRNFLLIFVICVNGACNCVEIKEKLTNNDTNQNTAAENEAVIINLSNIATQRAQLKQNEIYKTVQNLPEHHLNANDSEIIFDAEILIPFNSITPVRIQNLNDSLRQQIKFGIVQLHVGFPNAINLTLSYNHTLVPSYYQNGTNLGLIVYNGDDDANNKNNGANVNELIYIHNSFAKSAKKNESVQPSQNGNKNSSDEGVLALVVFIVYYRNSGVPVPGGCNLEYAMMQEAPIITIEQQNGFIIVDTPLAAASTETEQNELFVFKPKPSASKCETNDTKYLQYETRYLYLPSSLDSYSSHDFFNYIRSMLTVTSAEKTGFLAKKRQIPLNRRTFITMPGSNIIFVTIVKAPHKIILDDSDNEFYVDGTGVSSATYVPKMYAWSIYNDSNSTEWYYDSGLISICLAAALLLIGAIKCFINYQNTPIVFEVIFNFINIYITSLLIFVVIYLLFANETNLPSESADMHLLNLSTIGPFAFVLSVVCFVCCGFAGGCRQTSVMDSAVTPVKQVFQQLAVQLAICFFFTSMLLFFSSSNIYTTSTSSTQLYLFYWLTTTTFIMIVLPSVLSFYWNNLILNSIWGGFFMTMAMAVLLKNPLRIVCIYAIRFILDVDEYRSGLTPPYGIEEYLLIIIGKILTITGIILQHRQKLNEDIIRRQHRFDRREGRPKAAKSMFSRPCEGSSSSIVNERTALLKH